ncbi:MAG TPA: hypothetical protein VJ719_12740 [Chthoniobacterales bacterium]|nr:hypothetical protein [Chthoniobacterales bacterium]
MISTVAIVGALIFTGLQVRTANRTRHETAAITVIQTTQSDSWTRAIDLLRKLPDNANTASVLAAGPEVERAIFEFGVRLETIGYMVFQRIIPLHAIDDLVGGVTFVYWSRAKQWIENVRNETGNAKFLEWSEWLVDRIAERRSRLGLQPAHLRFKSWRE